MAGGGESVIQISLPADVEPSPRFCNVNPSQISGLAIRSDRNSLRDLGEVEGVARTLESSISDGILGNDDDIAARKEFFSPNSYLGPKRDQAKGVFACSREAINDPLILLLLIYILVSLGFGIKDHGIKSIWLERGTQLVEIIALLVLTSMMNFWPITQPRPDLSAHRLRVQVKRNGGMMSVFSDEVVVGDVVHLSIGDQVPADGLYIGGYQLHLKRITKGSTPQHAAIDLDNPFIFSGSMVCDGSSLMIVTAVRNQNKQEKWIEGKHADELKKLASTLRWLGRYFAAFAFMWFLLSFVVEENQAETVGVSWNKRSDISELLIALVGILATCAIIVFTSNLEGLTLAIKSILARSLHFLMKNPSRALEKMLALYNQVASVDIICCNINGTLTCDESQVKEIWIGLSSTEEVLSNLIPVCLGELLHQNFALNTRQPHSDSPRESCLSSSEKAVCEWATRKLGMDTESLLSSWEILLFEPFNPVSKTGGVMINKGDAIHVHRKGAADVILPMCSHYYETNGNVCVLDEKKRGSLEHIVQGMEEKGLKSIAFAHRKATSSEGFSNSSRQELTLLGLVGFENPVRKGFRKIVKDCQRAGIKLRLLTGEGLSRARFLALIGGLLNEDDNIDAGCVVEGEEFRNYTAEERMKNVDQICVLANATPLDKLLMVQTLRKKGHVVAYVGAGLGDAEALKKANVGICFGTQGRAEILKACSDFVIPNESFRLVFDILKWGRGFYNSLETYLQFLLIAVYVDLLVDFVMTLYPSGLTLFYAGSVISRGELPTPVFQLLWVKLIFGTVAPLSLLTKHPSGDLMSKPGRVLDEPLMTRDMRRNIAAQTSCQVLLLLAIHFMGSSVLKLSPDEKNTTIFTTYMLSQVLNLVYAKMHDRRNHLQKIHNEKCFWGIVGLIMLLQVMMVEVWKSVSGTARLDSRQWASCILMSAASIPTSLVLRYIYAIKITYLTTKSKIE